MELGERAGCYKAIEQHRKRPLIVYATSTRTNLTASMASDAVREFVDQIDAVANGDAVDVLIHSSGGDALTAWKLMSLLRERFKKVGVLVPYMAFSAATIFALGADEIVMHPHASLGPIDPQITVSLGDKQRKFAYEDLGAFLHFLSKDVKLTEQAHFAAVSDKLFTTVDPLVVGAARRASELSAEVGERLLKLHMKQDDRRCHQIAQNLNKSFFAHGDAVSRTRARSLELPIAKSNPELEKLLWRAFLEIEKYMELRKPFNVLEFVLANPEAAAQIQPNAPLALPKDMPPDLATQIYQQAAQQALARARGAAAEVPYSAVLAIIESARHVSRFTASGKATAFRLPDGKIQLLLTEAPGSWQTTASEGVTVMTQAAGRRGGTRGRGAGRS